MSLVGGSEINNGDVGANFGGKKNIFGEISVVKNAEKEICIIFARVQINNFLFIDNTIAGAVIQFIYRKIIFLGRTRWRSVLMVQYRIFMEFFFNIDRGQELRKYLF